MSTRRSMLVLAVLAMAVQAHAGGFLKGSRGASGGQSLTVSWGVLPTTKADGSALTIATQKVYYDTSTRQGTTTAYASSATVSDGTTLTKVITGLTANTNYCFAVVAVDAGGIESSPSIEVCATTAP